MPAQKTGIEDNNALTLCGVSYGRRLQVLIADGILLLTVLLIIIITAVYVADANPGIAGAIIGLFYFALFVYLVVAKRSSFGTLGYRLAGLKVVDVHGNRPSLWRMLVRAAPWFILGPLVIIHDLFAFGIHGNRQSLGDRLAGTYVIPRNWQPSVHRQSRYSIECFDTFSIICEE